MSAKKVERRGGSRSVMGWNANHLSKTGTGGKQKRQKKKNEESRGEREPEKRRSIGGGLGRKKGEHRAGAKLNTSKRCRQRAQKMLEGDQQKE